MKRAWKKLKPWAGYTDVVLASAASIVVAGVVVTDHLSERAALGATLFVLGAVALSLLHDRTAREKMKDHVGDALHALERAVTSGAPYETRSLHACWEILTEDGTDATLTTKRELTFLQNNVPVVYTFAGSEGGDVLYKGAKGASKGSAHLEELTRLEAPIQDENGDQLYLVSLDRLARVGDQWIVEENWRFIDAFPKKKEFVTQTVKFPVRTLSVEIVWPAARPPASLRISRTIGKPKETLINKVKTRPDGRRSFRHTVDDAVVGEVLVFNWNW